MGAAAVALVAVGCAGDPPPVPRVYTEEGLNAEITADTKNPWPHYHLGQLFQRRGKYREAISQYGLAINALPPRSATRPVLALGLLHHGLANPDPAERCYREVLDTVASDSRSYVRNDDYKVAAIGLAALLGEREDAKAELGALRQRFLSEFEGAEDDWSGGPTWVKPLNPPPETSGGQ